MGKLTDKQLRNNNSGAGRAMDRISRNNKIKKNQQIIIKENKRKVNKRFQERLKKEKKEKNEENDFEVKSEIANGSLCDGEYKINELEINSKNKKDRRTGHDVDQKKTLFIRGIPFSSTENELREEMEKKGKVIFAKIVVDKYTGKSLGKGFVKFANPKVPKEILENEALIENQISIKNNSENKNCHVALPASLALEGYGVSLGGRRLLFSEALTPEDAERKRKDHSEEKQKNVKKSKNYHLLKLGHFEAGSREMAELSPPEKRRRLDAMKEREIKISNSNFFINPNCLCFRNLSASTTALDLRMAIVNSLTSTKMGQDSLTKYKNQIMINLGEKLKIKKSISKKDCNDEKRTKKIKFKKLAEYSIGKIRMVADKSRKISVPISRDRDEIKSVSKSRGFGFVEFPVHEIAIVILNLMNNIPNSFLSNRKPIVEFAIEDKRALRTLALRIEKSNNNRQ